MNEKGHIAPMISAIAMAMWLSAGLFHPVMQTHLQADVELTRTISHDLIVMDAHTLCPLCFGVVALPSDSAPFQVIQTLWFEELTLEGSQVVAHPLLSNVSNRAPPSSIG
ncbi:MAG: hypothetical protein WEA36_06490 [Balneolaceae bacterium]